MTEEEELKFCGTVCLAASRLGIVIHESNQSESGKMFQWFDPSTSRLIKSSLDKDIKKSLVKACEVLVNYFNPIK